MFQPMFLARTKWGRHGGLAIRFGPSWLDLEDAFHGTCGLWINWSFNHPAVSWMHSDSNSIDSFCDFYRFLPHFDRVWPSVDLHLIFTCFRLVFPFFSPPWKKCSSRMDLDHSVWPHFCRFRVSFVSCFFHFCVCVCVNHLKRCKTSMFRSHLYVVFLHHYCFHFISV